MKIIDFDLDVHWQMPAINALPDCPTDRHYYAAPSPYLLVLVIRGEFCDGVAGNLYNNGIANKKYRCLVGNHPGAEFPLFCLPQFAGYTHSKLTVLGPAPADAVPDMTLSEFLAGCPNANNLSEYRLTWKDYEAQRLVHVPEKLAKAASGKAALHGLTLDEAVWDMLVDYLLS